MLNLATGDRCFVINGRKTSAFEAQVTRVDDATLTVYVPEKDDTQRYNLDGSPIGGHSDHNGISRSELVPLDDRRAIMLNTRRTHRVLHEEVLRRAKRFREDPSLPNDDALRRAVIAWSNFVQKVADDVMLRADSLEDYLRMTTNS